MGPGFLPINPLLNLCHKGIWTESADKTLQPEIDFYRRREAAERDAAARTSSKEVRALRIGIAERYACLAAEAEVSSAAEPLINRPFIAAP